MAGEEILIIGQYLAKIWKTFAAYFWDTVYAIREQRVVTALAVTGC